jgi:hypothetical protein
MALCLPYGERTSHALLRVPLLPVDLLRTKKDATDSPYLTRAREKETSRIFETKQVLCK